MSTIQKYFFYFSRTLQTCFIWQKLFFFSTIHRFIDYTNISKLITTFKHLKLIRKRGQSRRSLVGRAPGQTSKTKYKSYFFGYFLSADFWQKLWEEIKTAMKSFSKICRSESELKVTIIFWSHLVCVHICCVSTFLFCF